MTTSAKGASQPSHSVLTPRKHSPPILSPARLPDAATRTAGDRQWSIGHPRRAAQPLRDLRPWKVAPRRPGTWLDIPPGFGGSSLPWSRISEGGFDGLRGRTHCPGPDITQRCGRRHGRGADSLPSASEDPIGSGFPPYRTPPPLSPGGQVFLREQRCSPSPDSTPRCGRGRGRAGSA